MPRSPNRSAGGRSSLSDRTGSADPAAMADFITGPDFEVAAFKGQKLTLRHWDLQLRQPILLADGQTVVSVSPHEGFLHQHSELDTLGTDRPETKCAVLEAREGWLGKETQ